MAGLAWSYVHGATSTPLRGETIGATFDRIVARWPDRSALVVRHQGIRWTWQDLAERVEAFAAGLVGLGLEAGDRVGIWSPNKAQWVIAQLATAKAGLVLVNINPAHYKIPRYVKFVDGFPLTVTGKVQKYMMRQEMVRELAASAKPTA
jgi:acyl-CoA synthetase (AMP-forming)/AMP-acid ligase II